MKFSIKDFFSKRDQIYWSHLLKKYLMENFFFVQCDVWGLSSLSVKAEEYSKPKM